MSWFSDTLARAGSRMHHIIQDMKPKPPVKVSPTSWITERFPELLEEKSPMLVMPLIAFKKQNRLCRNINVWRAEALEKGWLVPREENHIVIFVSSRWWGDGTPDFEEPHASAQQKHVQIFKAASRLAKRLDIDRTRVYLWIDWSCIAQDDAEARAAGLASLVPYVATSDLFLIPVEHASLEGVAAVDPQSIPNYGERAWCRLECAIFSLWAEMSQPAAAAKKVKVRMWAAAADGSLRRFGAARYHAFDKRDLPSGGALTDEGDRETIVALESKLLEAYGEALERADAAAVGGQDAVRGGRALRGQELEPGGQLLGRRLRRGAREGVGALRADRPRPPPQ